jgi:ABC-type antimicrobial peptide transport system permease subunit
MQSCGERPNWRTPELGVRLALGATRRQITALVLRESMVRVAAGVAIGLAVAALAGLALNLYLYRLSPWNGWVYGGSAVLVTAAAVLASYLPARRAAAVDPMITLRQQ